MPTFAGQLVQSTGIATGGRLTSGIFSGPDQAALITTLQGIANGSMICAIDGPQRALPATDFSAITTLNEVAGLIQAGYVAWATCVWNAGPGQFVITSLTTGVTSMVGFATMGTGTFIGTHLRLTSAAGATTVAGQPGGGGPQWVPCDGRHLHLHGRMHPRGTADYMRRVGFFGGGMGIKPGKLRVPRDYVGNNWYVSTEDNATEPTLPGNTPTVRRPPLGVR